MGHNEIKRSRLHIFFFLVFINDQEIRGKRHYFPDDEKEKGIVGADDHDHSGQENIIKKAERADVIFFVIMLYISQCIDGSK